MRLLVLALVVFAPSVGWSQSADDSSAAMQGYKLNAPSIVVKNADGTPAAPMDQTSVRVSTGPDGEQVYTVWPPSVAEAVLAAIPGAAGHIVVSNPAAEAVAAAAQAGDAAKKDVDPLTQGWLDHCQLLDERGIGRGQQIGGNAALGMRLGGKGQANEIGDVDPAVRASVDGWNEQGALVTSVVPGAPADIAGLQPGDVVLQLAGVWIDTPDMLIRLASRLELARDTEVLYLREGSVQRTWVAAIDRHEMEKL
jgi:hypothetical protein